MIDTLNLRHVRLAAENIQPFIHHTPVLRCNGLDHLAGLQLFFKCENFQKVGAFKFRGACNAVCSLPKEKLRQGVATHSSGNHAAALALAAHLQDLPAYVVMPENSPQVKKNAVVGYGAHITYCQATLQAREQGLKNVVEETGAVFIHPFDHLDVIAGQATAALELLDEIGKTDVIMAPVGGGGLMSGTSIAAHGLFPSMRLIGVEPEGADDAMRSIHSGRVIPQTNPHTIADGLLTSLSELTFSILSRHLEDIYTVSEEEIVDAMRHVWERMKIIIEPSAAVAVAGAFKFGQRFRGKKVGVILSGGNVQLDRLPFGPQPKLEAASKE